MNVSVIGAGLAGSEAAWQLARRGVQVMLYEMKPQKRTPAHALLPTFVYDSRPVTEGHVPRARGKKKLCDGNGRRTCAVHGDFDIFQLLAHDLQRVLKTCQGDDGGSVLVIMASKLDLTCSLVVSQSNRVR